MFDDIDWTEASSDFGLVSLCRELEALAAPVQALTQMRSNRTKERRNVSRRTRLQSGREAIASPY